MWVYTEHTFLFGGHDENPLQSTWRLGQDESISPVTNGGKPFIYYTKIQLPQRHAYIYNIAQHASTKKFKIIVIKSPFEGDGPRNTLLQNRRANSYKNWNNSFRIIWIQVSPLSDTRV